MGSSLNGAEDNWVSIWGKNENESLFHMLWEILVSPTLWLYFRATKYSGQKTIM